MYLKKKNNDGPHRPKKSAKEKKLKLGDRLLFWLVCNERRIDPKHIPRVVKNKHLSHKLCSSLICSS